MREQPVARPHDEVQGAGPRRVGRPRKWASEAERKQAYRQRLAADLEDPLTVRRELRTERRRAAGLQQQNDRLRARLAVAERRVEEADDATRTAQELLAWSKELADRDRRQLFEARAMLAEVETEVDRLRRSESHPPPAPGRPPTRRSPIADRPLPVPVRAEVSPRCSAMGWHIAGVSFDATRALDSVTRPAASSIPTDDSPSARPTPGTCVAVRCVVK
jgi:hypothetical protein